MDGNTQTTLEDVRFLNVGISLMVAPRIYADDNVALDVQLELSTLVEIRNGFPVVDRATAQSSVNVRDGGTVILGGLRQRSRTKVERGVPGLRKVPVLGALFRNRRRDKDESEILLVLRPQITSNDHGETPEIEAMHESIQGGRPHGAAGRNPRSGGRDWRSIETRPGSNGRTVCDVGRLRRIAGLYGGQQRFQQVLRRAAGAHPRTALAFRHERGSDAAAPLP